MCLTIKEPSQTNTSRRYANKTNKITLQIIDCFFSFFTVYIYMARYVSTLPLFLTSLAVRECYVVNDTISNWYACNMTYFKPAETPNEVLQIALQYFTAIAMIDCVCLCTYFMYVQVALSLPPFQGCHWSDDFWGKADSGISQLYSFRVYY